MNVPLLGLSVELLLLQRVIDDVARDAGYEELRKYQVDAITAFLHGKMCSSVYKQAAGNLPALCFSLLHYCASKIS